MAAGARALAVRGDDDQHDDPGRPRHRRRGGRRRRHHRHREHRAAAAPAPRGGQHASRSRPDHPRRLARGAQPDRLRDADRSSWPCCRSSSWRACPARSSSRWRSSYALAVLASMVVALTVTPALSLILLREAPLERRDAPLVRWLQARLQRACSRAIVDRPRPAYARSGRDRAGRPRGAAAARAVAAARLQGARLPDALGDQARHVASGDERGSRPGPAGSCAPFPGSATSAPTSGRRCSPTRSSASTSARTGSASTRRSTTTRPWPRSRRWSTATRASSATCRPT